MADISEKGIRRLPYPLLNPISTSQQTPDDAIDYVTTDVFPVDPDESIEIKLEISLNEYVALSSALDVGRDIAYSEDTTMLWWLWAKVFKGLAMTCEDVADCIESEIDSGNAALINTLTQNNINNGFGNLNRVNGDVTTVLDRNAPLSLQQTINPAFECNLDKLWGGIRHGIVERLDDTARDLLEDLAAINDLPQRFQAFIDVIPVLGDIAEGVVTLATEVIPDILNLYNSYSSEAQLDEIACDLFGMVCEECRYPTFEELYNYYSTLGYELDAMDSQTLAPLVSKISGMISATAPASIVYHTMITFQLFTLYLQAQWNGNAGIDTILKFAAIGEDFDSNNWLDLCETCDDPYRIKIWDFTSSPTDADITSGFSFKNGVYIAGSGFAMLQQGAATDGGMTVGLRLDPTWRIRAIGLKFANAASGSGALTSNALRPTRGIQSGATGIAYDWGTTGWTFYENGLLSITGFQELALVYARAMSSNVMLSHIGIIFDSEYSPSDAMPTSTATFSGTVFP